MPPYVLGDVCFLLINTKLDFCSKHCLTGYESFNWIIKNMIFLYYNIYVFVNGKKNIKKKSKKFSNKS